MFTVLCNPAQSKIRFCDITLPQSIGHPQVLGILKTSPNNSHSTLWDIRHCGDTNTTIHTPSTAPGLFLSSGHPRYDPIHIPFFKDMSPTGVFSSREAPSGIRHLQGTPIQMLVSSICVLFPAWGISWTQSILVSPNAHRPPSVMCSFTAHCPPLLRDETSWGLLRPLRPAPGPLAPQALQGTVHPPFPCSQPFLHPLSTPEHGLPKQPDPSPSPHRSLQRYNQPPPPRAFHIPKFLQLLSTLGRARLQSGTLGSCPPVTGAAGEQDTWVLFSGERRGLWREDAVRASVPSLPTPGLLRVAEVGTEWAPRKSLEKASSIWGN